MATKRSLILNSADQNSNKKQRAVTEVNPKVDRTVVAELGEKLNALTENTLVEATSLDKTNLDDALMEKRTPALEFIDLPVTTNEAFDQKNAEGNENNGWIKFDINYDGDGQLYYPNYDEWPSGTYQTTTETIIDEAVVTDYSYTEEENGRYFFPPANCKCVYVNGKWQLWVTAIDVYCKLIVKATETDTCNAATVTVNAIEIE